MPDTRQMTAGFGTFLQLERAARHAATPEELAFVAVNETRRLIAYRQAAVIGDPGGRARVETVSGVAVLDRNAPFLRWLGRAAGAAARTTAAVGNAPRRIDPAALPEDIVRDWAEWAAAHVLWVPLPSPDGRIDAAMWLARDEPWQDSDLLLLERLADCYGHARTALTAGRRGRARPARGQRRRRLLLWAVPVALAAAMAIPVRQSALAPAEVVPRDPVLVAAPLDGVIAEMAVAPNQPVAAGDPLLSFDDTELRNAHAVAERTLAVARAEARQAAQAAFNDPRDSARLAVLEARADMRAAELAYAAERLSRVRVTAPAGGIAVFSDPNDWIGRPVATGQRIMLIADPGQAELRIRLPVADAIALSPGAPVDLFLDVAPLDPVAAVLTHAAYEAEVTPAGALAYRVAARFAEDAAIPRIGLQGTAKIYGETVPLGLYLFRRPIAAVRQTLGL
jgi:multidrug resistance efflux pump